jgi:non-heme Fe2+,alpha-ketoglutarate-dependent halogenase
MAQPTEFSIIPSQQELEQIQRELRFHPSPVHDPRTLTAEQVEFFNRCGYLKGLRIFTPDEIASHRQYFDELLARVLAAGGNSYSISSAHLKYGRVYDLLTDRRIVEHVADLLGDDVVAWGAHYFCKLPHDGKAVAWHQDASYWPLTPSKTVTVWLAIDDVDRENGCMRYLPGSHLFGHLPYRISRDDEGNVLDQTVEDVERFGEPVDVVMQAGEIAIHCDLLLHGSEANHSDRRRCGLTLRYCAAEVTAHLDWHLKGVLVHGSADPRRWPGAARPAND